VIASGAALAEGRIDTATLMGHFAGHLRAGDAELGDLVTRLLPQTPATIPHDDPPRRPRRPAMLMRFDPFRDLDRMAQLVNQQSDSPRVLSMPMDAYRDGDRFVVHFDLPGVDPDSIDLTVEKNVLTVRAERSWEPTENQDVLISERPRGVFSRQLFLGDSLDVDRIDAAYRNGVLTLTIPVAEQAKPRKVEIHAGNGEAHSIPATATASAGTS
jgi:HSP20 family protein